MAVPLPAPVRLALSRIPRPSAIQDAAFEPDPGYADDTSASAPVVVMNNARRPEDESGAVPDSLRVSSAWAWRLMVLGAFIYIAFRALGHLSEVTIPFVVSLLLTAAFWPMRDWLVQRKVKPGLAALLCLLVLAGVVLGIVSLVSLQIASQWDELTTEAVNSVNRLVSWLESGPFHVSNAQFDSLLKQAEDYVSNSRSKIAGYATTVGSSLTHFFAGLLLTLFTVFYFLFEGRALANTASALLPNSSRERIMDSATRGWLALVAYVRAAVIVAACDGLGALVGALCLGSKMWLAIGALTFLCAFVPLLGAVFSGAVATGVVFVTLGPVRALIMLLVFIAVLELEGHVMQPFLLGKAVKIHPLIVLFGIAVGMIIGGPVGALFIVPLMAFVNAFIRGWHRKRRRPASLADATPTPTDDDGPADRVSDGHEPGQPPRDAGLDTVAETAAGASAVEHEPDDHGEDPADPEGVRH